MPKQKLETKTKPKKITKSVSAGSTTKQQIPNEAKPKLSNSFVIFRHSIETLLSRWQIFSLITAIYFVCNLILVKGLSTSVNTSSLKSATLSFLHGSSGGASNSSNFISTLFSSSTSAGATNSNTYQTILFVVFSLVIIWALRQSFTKNKIRISDVFYKSLYPLIPFLIIGVLIGLELTPLVVSGYLYSLIFGHSIAVNFIEKFIWAVVCILPVILSLYWLSTSLFALYIVTLPDVRPMQALRSAKHLVKSRRALVMRKVMFLPISLVILIVILVLPFSAWIPVVAVWFFIVLTLIAVSVSHSYMYNLYRELL